MDWPGCIPATRPMTAWMGSSPLLDPEQDYVVVNRGWMKGWMSSYRLLDVAAEANYCEEKQWNSCTAGIPIFSDYYLGWLKTRRFCIEK